MTSVPPVDPAHASKRGLGVEDIAFAALVVLALGGMAVADFSARSGLTYWLVVIPLFAAVVKKRSGFFGTRKGPFSTS